MQSCKKMQQQSRICSPRKMVGCFQRPNSTQSERKSQRRGWRGRRSPGRAGTEAEGGGGGERFLAGIQGRVPGREATDVVLPDLHLHHQPGRKCAEWAEPPFRCSHGIPGQSPAAPTERFFKVIFHKKKLMPEHWVAV